MPTSTTDANDNDTTITYGNVTCPGGTVTDLYPTLTVVADGTTIERTSSAVYDCYTGLVTTATDEDNDVSVVTEYDDLGRPLKVRNAYGTALESWVQTEYHDADRYVVTKADLEAVGDAKKVAIQHFDQLGRVRLSRTLENAATESASNEEHGIKVQSRYAATYSSPNGYTYQLTSNPYRAATSSAASSEPTMGWTRSKAHHQGRHSEVETFSGSALPAPWSTNTSSTGVVQTDIDADATTVTDQAGKLRRSITNSLGQLVRVDEPDDSSSTGSLGTVASPNQATSYAFDTLGNLTTVTQGSQTRTFTYSSLSRLLSATNPESGTINYEYDNNSNLIEKTDARGIVTTYSYNSLNQITDRIYAAPSPTPTNYQTTPDVEYTYGTTAPKVGKLTKVESSVSTTEYTSFDILGRVTASKQTTDGTDYTSGYVYNLSGALIEQTYPSGRVVKNVLDSNGDLALVQSKKNSSSGYWNYASSFTYNAAGAVTGMQLGNGRWESTTFNSRLQPTQIALGATPGATNLLDLDYAYGATNENNGNVMSQSITVPGLTHPFVQTYTYDPLNRIANAIETNNSTQTWKQTFVYDRYGNRNFDEANTTFEGFDKLCNGNTELCPELRKKLNPSINTSDNRLSSGQGYSFDDTGSTTRDAHDRKFTYDAENKQIKVESLSPGTNTVTGTIGEYFYDGDGKRVKKVVPRPDPEPDEVTIFVYDASGKLIAEYSTIVASSNDAKVAYLTNDHLGSPRINTDANGAVTARHDYHPFGEEISGSSQRVGLGYSSDTVRKQFTGHEGDAETRMYYAKARMLTFTLARFTSPDPLLSSARVENPQSWSRYAYVLNNPLLFIDPFGLFEWAESAGGSLTDEQLAARGRDRSLTRRQRRDARRQLSFRQSFRAARQRASEAATSTRLTSDQQQQVRESVASYGEENEDNGVTVGIRRNTRGARGTTRLMVDDTISVEFRRDLEGDSFAATLAHEGRHVGDAQNWLESGHATGGDTDMNHYAREGRAWNVSSFVGQGLNMGKVSAGSDGTNRSYKVWSRGWKASDVQTKRANGIANIQDLMRLKATDTDNYSNEHVPKAPK